MKKSKFIKMFKIEEAVVKKMDFEGSNLIITVAMNVVSYPMGNNIREEHHQDYFTTYVFENAVLTDCKMEYITHIYNTYLVNDNIILETNMGMITIKSKEIKIKGR